MRVTGKYSVKRYKCRHCGAESNIGTNHWGAVYSRCNACAWRRPLEANCHDCLEPPPEGIGLPEEWKVVRLGDIATIT